MKGEKAFSIDPDTIYSREALAEGLAPLGIDVDHFIRRTRPRRVFRMGWLGSDILTAIREAPALHAAAEIPEPKNRGGRRKGKRGPAQRIRLVDVLGPETEAVTQLTPQAIGKVGFN